MEFNMSRKAIITLHLALAAFFAPILLMVGLSGGFYLISEKGNVEQQEIYRGEIASLNLAAKDAESQIREFIKNHNIDHEFEYIKGNSKQSITRPTSKQHLLFEIKDEQLIVTKRTPNFVASIVELHKGHGPRAFKTFQKFMALGLLLILLSGLYLGLTSPMFKYKTLYISGLGSALFLFLALF
jgi:hypothetical protein